MPLYQFSCKKCNQIFEMFLRSSEANRKVPCPSCKSDDVERCSEAEQNNVTPGVCGAKKDT
jgi:putative FmdB family regulatory protein